MSILKEYMVGRRKKKLEEVTRALEQLKHENVATDSFKPKNTTPSTASYPPIKSGKDFFFIGILLVSVVVLLIFSFYYRGQFTKLNDDYQEKVDKLKILETELGEKLQDLNETKSIKEQSEKELSQTKGTLEIKEAKIDDLKTQIADLEDDIVAKRSEVDNLTRTISDQRREIEKWRDCIEDEYDGNLSIC